ncbi:DUF1304 domain-containing protein [Homoserinibacter sp. YIM 151385]|uniref:DUF1304 domain-containing protein n=1 Tax=Homoserinibacter sp. YIM 151385 TaxID=2985506 RepID=UPI0022F0BC97|nr:DUF1304 domain-containing protein [Homoserinibacter sp. YIM 151385]WBU37174.1 DUF1304 domain-containing protein [Homoserinibacter sp. YIM 151385]
MSALSIAGLVAAALAALVHVLIFVFESVTWSQPRTWRRFGLSTQEEADHVRPMAYNQGFYNLFLAIGVVTGIVLYSIRNRGGGLPLEAAGFGVLLFALTSMVLAAVVLVTSSPKLARAAATQGVLPLAALALLIAGSATGAGPAV